MSPDRQRSIVVGWLLAALLVAGGLLLSVNASLQRLDLVLYDGFLPLQSRSISDQVVVVAIDDASLLSLGRWPWPRRRHVELLDRLTALGARVVAFDMLFSEPQVSDPQADQALAAAFARNGRTVLVVAPVQETRLDPISELLPIPELAAAAAAIGHVDVELDMDGLCRSFYLYGGVGDAHWPALALAVLQVAGESVPLPVGPVAQDAPVNARGWLRRGRLLIPFADTGTRPLELSYADVLNDRVPASAVRGKYVLVGATATGLGDAISTPASRSHERMPGVELNGHILSGLLRGDSIQEVTRTTGMALTALLVLVTVIAVVLVPLRFGVLVMLAGMAGGLLLSALLLIGWQLWFPPAAALAMLVLALPLWSAWWLAVESRRSQRLLRRLEHQARHHVATGLPNQGMLEDRLRHLVEPGGAPPGVAGLMILHIDWPGSASAMLGRPMGDAVLSAIAERLREVVRGDDFVAHLSGDDFAVLTEGMADAAAVCDTGHALLQALQKPLAYGGEELFLAPRMGISLWPADGRDAVTLLRNAYTAMFKARLDGAGLMCVYSADIGQAAQVRSQLEQALIHALERGEFELYYQPQVAAETGKVVGVEALLRWHNPQLGWVGPDAFIPVAEHAGLINAIGDWVLETACRQLQAWHQAGLGPLRLAVNLSPLQFAAPGLVAGILQVVESVGIAPALLELEITESTVMRDLDAAVRAMRAIKAQGLALAIDDFGTGYSSLSSLRHFPLDRIKIDQSFVREIGDSTDATEIVLAIIAMAKRLRLSVIAEGVETADQAEFLHQHGCDELQGYFYSRPLPADELAALLHASLDGVPA